MLGVRLASRNTDFWCFVIRWGGWNGDERVGSLSVVWSFKEIKPTRQAWFRCHFEQVRWRAYSHEYKIGVISSTVGHCVAAGSGGSGSLWVIVVGPHDVTMVKGTTSETQLLLLRFGFSVQHYPVLVGSLVCRNFVSSVYKGSVNIIGSGSNIFSCMLSPHRPPASSFFGLAWEQLRDSSPGIHLLLCSASWRCVYAVGHEPLPSKACTCFRPRYINLGGHPWRNPWVLVWKEPSRLVASSERGSNQTLKQSHALGDRQGLSMNLSCVKASCYLVCLLFGEVSSADEFHWEKKIVFWFRPQPLWKKEKRGLLDGELCEAELRVIWGAMCLAVPVTLGRVCGIIPVWNRQIHISDNLLHNSP